MRQSEDIMDKRKVKPLILNQWFLFISLDLLRKSIMMEKDFQEKVFIVAYSYGRNKNLVVIPAQCMFGLTESDGVRFPLYFCS